MISIRSAHPARMVGTARPACVHPLALRRRAQDPGPPGGEDRAGRVGELPGPAPDEVPHLPGQRPGELPGGLHGPSHRRMRADPGQAGEPVTRITLLGSEI